MKTSPKGRDFIKRFEGFEPDAYQDIAGVWTIGYGHTSAEFAFPGAVVSKALAEQLLKRDLAPLDEFLSSLFDDRLMQYEHDACASFLFNVGQNAFRADINPNTSQRALLVSEALETAGDRCLADRSIVTRPLADAFLWWDKATVNGLKTRVPGLTRRRIEEAELLLYADYELVDDGVVNAPSLKELMHDIVAA